MTTPVRALYDGGVAYTDELLRRVVDALRERGTLDRTILVVLADHGELLGERSRFFGHGPSIYQSLVHVPLLVRYPPRVAPGTRVAAPVSTLGVFATILDLAEIEPPPTLQVGSLVSTPDGADGGARALRGRRSRGRKIPGPTATTRRCSPASTCAPIAPATGSSSRRTAADRSCSISRATPPRRATSRPSAPRR